MVGVPTDKSSPAHGSNGAQTEASGRQLYIHHPVPDAEAPTKFDPQTPANLVPMRGRCHTRIEGWPIARQLTVYNVGSLREFAFDASHRTTVNDRLSEIFASQTAHLTESMRDAVIARYEPDHQVVTLVTDQKDNGTRHRTFTRAGVSPSRQSPVAVSDPSDTQSQRRRQAAGATVQRVSIAASTTLWRPARL